VRAHVGQVGHPKLVRRRRDELPLDQVGRALGLRAIAVRGLAGLLPRDPAQALGLHQPLDRAPGDRRAVAVQLGADLLRPVDAEVVLVRLVDQRHQLGIAHRARRRRAGVGGVVGARGDLHVADRLDPEPAALDDPFPVGSM
jgi:hypothetical protein